MGNDLQPAKPAAAVAARPGAAKPSPRHHRLRNGGWLLIGLLGVLGKSEVISGIAEHPRRLIAAFAVALGVSALRARPRGVAFSGAWIVAFALGLHPILLAVASGVAAYLLLMVVFIAIGSILLARQDRGGARRR